MRWFFEVALIGIASSWKWLLASVVVVGALVGILFAVGVLGGGGDAGHSAGYSRLSHSGRGRHPGPDAGPDTGTDSRAHNGSGPQSYLRAHLGHPGQKRWQFGIRPGL